MNTRNSKIVLRAVGCRLRDEAGRGIGKEEFEKQKT